MTISTQVAEVTLPGNGATTAFAYPFLIPEASDVVVTLTVVATEVETVLTSAQYSISGLGDEAGGSVTYPLSGSPLAAGNTITIQRVLPITQSVDLINQGLFDPEVIEGEFDYLTMLMQQMQYQIDGTAVPSVQAVTPPQGRLTLTTALPVLTASVSAATSIFYTPFLGALLPLWDGSSFIMTLFTEITLALDSNSGHTGYHQSGKVFDVFGIDADSIGTGPAWSSATTRGTGAGTTELELKNGILTNKNQITLRTGSASGDTVTVDANAATYLGSFITTANGQTQVLFGGLAASGSEAYIGIWNAYNRVPVEGFVGDSTDTYTYTTATVRAANASNTMRFSFLSGFSVDYAAAHYASGARNSSANVQVTAGIGYDSTSALSGRHPLMVTQVANQPVTTWGDYQKIDLGFHYMQACEYSAATGTTTWIGDNGAPTLVQEGLTYRWRY